MCLCGRDIITAQSELKRATYSVLADMHSKVSRPYTRDQDANVMKQHRHP